MSPSPELGRRLRCLLLVTAIGAAAGCATGRPVPRPFPGAPLPPGAADAAGEPARPDPAPSTPAALDDESPVAAPALATLLSTALTLRGVPYRNGGTDPSAGFDCSGFVQYVFARHGVPLPREVRDQYTAGAPVGREAVQPGDLVFFETVARGASHVGIALGDGSFVHAPSSRGVVRVESYAGAYWASRWVGARRVVTGPAAAE